MAEGSASFDFVRHCRYCGTPIGFRDDVISESGTRIPLDIKDGSRHNCPLTEGKLRF